METEDSFFGNDPGAVRYGNFINYYSFHPPETRISPVLDGIWNGIDDALILDIGCNSGDLTQKLYEHLVSTKINSAKNEETSNLTQQLAINNFFIMGLDLDSVLITRAKEGNRHPNNVFYECLDIMTDDCDTKIVEILHKFEKTFFHSIFCFSVSMWIHLNHGDDGLSSFIRKICKWTDCVVIEPQSWKSYTSAVRRLKRAGCTFCVPPISDVTRSRTMEINIDHMFRENGFVKVSESIPSKWSRNTFVFRRSVQ